jgi:hypothetical protein
MATAIPDATVAAPALIVAKLVTNYSLYLPRNEFRKRSVMPDGDGWGYDRYGRQCYGQSNGWANGGNGEGIGAGYGDHNRLLPGDGWGDGYNYGDGDGNGLLNP